MATTTKRKASMADRVYNALKDEIFAFRLIPGDKFSEGDVGARLKASRTPVREALYRLQREGYVEVLFRSGWQVKPLDARQVDELYDLRIALERAAVERLCDREQPLSIPLSQKGEQHFHCELVEAAGNRELTRIHREIMDRLCLARSLAPTCKLKILESAETHTQILDAIECSDLDRASEKLTRHIRAHQEAIRNHLPQRAPIKKELSQSRPRASQSGYTNYEEQSES